MHGQESEYGNFLLGYCMLILMIHFPHRNLKVGKCRTGKLLQSLFNKGRICSFVWVYSVTAGH